MPIEHHISVWLRRTFGWVASRQSWLELGAAIGLIAAAAALWWLRTLMPVGMQLIVWTCLGIVAAAVFRKGWIKLFGPVLIYDMIRSGRRGRYILIRVLYAGLLFFLLFVVFINLRFVFDRGQSVMSPQDASRMVQTYFETFMVAQLLAVLLLTPGYVAGAVADEKNRRTLEFLLATDLRSREIILSKLGARVGQMFMFILTGLPILTILQFMGGVSPELVIAGFAVTAMTLLGLAGISIFHSVYYRKPRNAISVSYMTVLAYTLITFLLLALQRFVLTDPRWMGSAALGDRISPRSPLESLTFFLVDSLNTAITWINSGNLLILLGNFQISAFAGRLSADLYGLVSGYCLFHTILFSACLFWAVYRLRPVAMHQVSKPKQVRARFRFLGRPRLRGLPMVWKEVHVEGGVQFNWIGWIFVILLVLASFSPLVFMLIEFTSSNRFRYGPDIWRFIGTSMNIWVRTMSVLVGSLILLSVAVRASTCISSERDKDTWDSLLTTPLSSRRILFAKWLGNLASIRLGWLWLGLVYLIGLVTTGMHPIALPLVLGALVIYAAFVSMLGCWFSINCKTSMRATIWTLVWTVVLGVAHWLPWMLFGLIVAAANPSPRAARMVGYIAQFQAGLTPQFVLGFMPFCHWELRNSGDYVREAFIPFMTFSIVGIGLWALLGAVLTVMTYARLSKLTNRRGESQADFKQLPSIPRVPREDDLLLQVPPVSPATPATAGEGQVQHAILVDESLKPPPLPKQGRGEFTPE